MLFSALVLSVSFASALAGLSATNGTFAASPMACPDGQGPMNVTSGMWAQAQQNYGNNGSLHTAPAWIASYNTDTYNGACIAFGGNSVNTYPCESDYPTLCDDIPMSMAPQRMAKRFHGRRA